jgi:hypothetical protein
MDRDGLRALQAPLKARYRVEPDAALVTLAPSLTLDEGMSGSVQTGRAIAQAGLHPATGGDGTLLCSGDCRRQGAPAISCATRTESVPHASFRLRHALGVPEDRHMRHRGATEPPEQGPLLEHAAATVGVAVATASDFVR